MARWRRRRHAHCARPPRPRRSAPTRTEALAQPRPGRRRSPGPCRCPPGWAHGPDPLPCMSAPLQCQSSMTQPDPTSRRRPRLPVSSLTCRAPPSAVLEPRPRGLGDSTPTVDFRRGLAPRPWLYQPPPPTRRPNKMFSNKIHTTLGALAASAAFALALAGPVAAQADTKTTSGTPKKECKLGTPDSSGAQTYLKDGTVITKKHEDGSSYQRECKDGTWAPPRASPSAARAPSCRSARRRSPRKPQPLRPTAPPRHRHVSWPRSRPDPRRLRSPPNPNAG
jgi:hypothetical protein